MWTLWLRIPILGMYFLDEFVQLQGRICTGSFWNNNWEQQKCPQIRGQLNKLGYIHTMDYNIAVEGEVEVLYELLWKDFQHALLSARRSYRKEEENKTTDSYCLYWKKDWEKWVEIITCVYLGMRARLYTFVCYFYFPTLWMYYLLKYKVKQWLQKPNKTKSKYYGKPYPG